MSGLSAEQDRTREANSHEHGQTLYQDDREHLGTFAPVRLLQGQVDHLATQLEQAQQEKARLLSLLEAEQQARRELETKLLPAPIRTKRGASPLWLLLALLLLAALAVWREWPEIVNFWARVVG